MCGITGFWNFGGLIGKNELIADIDQMSKQLYHRGPDDGGNWVDETVGIALGHRRLAILDLSPEGHQPMLSANGRYVMVFNGEIYNFQEIKQDLIQLGYKFRGTSDTEVMLASFSEWGIKASVEKFVGMFAFAVWDREERELYLVRDRLGEKPLYYGWLGQNFVFASELKALKTHPQWQGDINRDSLTLFVRHNYIPAPHSIYQNIYKLLPGTFLKLSAPHIPTEPISYWSMESVVQYGQQNPFSGTEQEAIATLEQLLTQAITQQMIADVPLGAFLSGGIDSSTIVALMQSQSQRKIQTFCIGFTEESCNESHYAQAVASHLGTDHTDFCVTPQEAMDVIPLLPSLYDEPFSDSSQIPTFLVSQLAKQKVTVSLSGDAGDELFGGYNRYFLCNNVWQKLGWTSPSIRQVMSNVLTGFPSSTWNQIGSKLGNFLPTKLRGELLGDNIYKLADILNKSDELALYQRFVSHWKKPTEVVINAEEPMSVLQESSLNLDNLNFLEQMMYLDSITYLPEDILTKVDRAAMGVSLETRVPFLDHRVVEFAWQIPIDLKIRGNQGKWILKQILSKYVPSALFERPKMGFGIPIGSWLKTELRDWAESLLDTNKLKQQGFFHHQIIHKIWQQHLSGQTNREFLLWDILMFQAWLEENQ